MGATIDLGTTDREQRARSGSPVIKRKFTPIDAATVALANPQVAATPGQGRVLVAAAVLWCRHLQFPTARELASELGRSSPSTVLFGFSRLVNVQAALLALEWSRLDLGARSAPAHDGLAWLCRHAAELHAIDRASLRLPALVWAAVVSADRSQARGRADLAMSLHVLAAFADRGALPAPGDLRRVLQAAANLGTDAARPAIPA